MHINQVVAVNSLACVLACEIQIPVLSQSNKLNMSFFSSLFLL